MIDDIVTKVQWRRYAIDLNTGSEIDHVRQAIEITASECRKLCKSVKDTTDINPRLKPVVFAAVDSCIDNIEESFK